MQLQVPARGWFWSETAPMSGHPIAFLAFLGEDLGLPATAVHCRHTYAMGAYQCGISPLRARPGARDGFSAARTAGLLAFCGTVRVRCRLIVHGPSHRM